MKKTRIIILSALFTVLMLFGGCGKNNSIIPGGFGKGGNTFSILPEKNPEVPDLSQSFIVGYAGGGGYGTWYETTDPTVIVKSDKTAWVYMSRTGRPENDEFIGFANMTDEQYNNIINGVDRDKLYTLDPKNQHEVMDGGSSTLILYDINDEPLKYCGGYCPSNKDFLEMYKTVGDNLPWDEISELTRKFKSKVFVEEAASGISWVAGNDELFDVIKDTVEADCFDNTLSGYGFLDDEKKCARVSVEYNRYSVPEGENAHIRDYFFVIDDEYGIISLEVTYPSAKDDPESDRYIGDDCDFEAKYEDINFDGHKDITISLGKKGAGNDTVCCAYIWYYGKFYYAKSFEKIYNYRLDTKNEAVISTYTSGKDTVEERFVFDDFYLDWMFDYSTVDTKGLTHDDIQLFISSALYLNRGSKTEDGDMLSSKDYFDICDFLYYIGSRDVEVVTDYDTSTVSESRRIKYSDWEYLLKEVFNEQNPQKVKEKLRDKLYEMDVYYNPNDDCVYMEAGYIGYGYEHAFVSNVEKEGDRYILTFENYSDFSEEPKPYEVKKVTIEKADNKYGYRLVSVD